jgi:hypothetical protein
MKLPQEQLEDHTKENKLVQTLHYEVKSYMTEQITEHQTTTCPMHEPV